MKNMIKYVVSMVLTLAAVLPMQAQQENAAFYIYQNDGHFDGFFYDEVEKIRYSKLDTLGVEHEDVVSQEIVTADSTYRIMLSAIDSVGFVQPEIKFNPKLKDIRKTGLVDYVTYHGTEETDGETTLTLYIPKTREDLIPKEGDILVDFYAEYGGNVKRVNVDKSWSSGIMVNVIMDPISSFKDIFEQFTTVEEYQANQSGHLVRRRMAGVPEMTVGEFPSKEIRRADSSLEFDFFKFALNRHFALFTDSTENWNISIDINTETTFSARAVWNFSERKYVGLTLKINPSLAMGFTVDYKFKDVFPGWINETAAIYIPAAAPLFKVNLMPDAFFRGDCHATMNFQTPKLGGQVWIKFEADFDKKNLSDMWGATFGFGTPPGEKAPDPLEESEANTWSGSMEFNGFVQTGIQQKFAFGTGKLLSWLVDSSVEATTYIGPKLSGALNFSLSNVIDDELSVYNLVKDSKLTFNPLAVDFESKAKVSSWLGGTQEITLMDGSVNVPVMGMREFEAFVFPEFSLDVDVAEDEFNTQIGYKKATVTVKPSRNILKSVDFGAAIYDYGGKLIDCHFASEEGLPNYGMLEISWPVDKTFTYTFHSIPKLEQFVIRPIFKMGMFNVIASSPSYLIDGLYFRCKEVPPLVFDLANPQPITFPVETNALRMQTTIGCKAEIASDGKSVTLELDKEIFKNQHFTTISEDGKFVIANNEGQIDTGAYLYSLIIGDEKYKAISISPDGPGLRPATYEVTDIPGNEAEGEILTRNIHITSNGTDGDPLKGEGQVTWDITYNTGTIYKKEEVSWNSQYYGKMWGFKTEGTPKSGHASIIKYRKGGVPAFERAYTPRAGEEIVDATLETNIEFGESSWSTLAKSYSQKLTVNYKDGETDVRTWDRPLDDIKLGHGDD